MLPMDSTSYKYYPLDTARATAAAGKRAITHLIGPSIKIAFITTGYYGSVVAFDA